MLIVSVDVTQSAERNATTVATNTMSMSLKLNEHNVRRMSNRSNQTAVTVSTSTSTHTRSGSGSTATSTPPAALQSRGFADMSSIRIPIVGYEVMEERARFTVSTATPFSVKYHKK